MRGDLGTLPDEGIVCQPVRVERSDQDGGREEDDLVVNRRVCCENLLE